jgi:hypothetical protein
MDPPDELYQEPGYLYIAESELLTNRLRNAQQIGWDDIGIKLGCTNSPARRRIELNGGKKTTLNDEKTRIDTTYTMRTVYEAVNGGMNPGHGAE